MSPAIESECLRAAGIAPQSVEAIAGHPDVLRIRLSGSTLIWKAATRWEAGIHARIAAELNGVAPALHTAPVPLPQGAVGLLMEDLGGPSLGVEEQLAAYGRAAAKLASVHRHFDGSRLAEPKQFAAGLSDAVPEVPSLLRMLATVAGLPLDAALIDEIEGAGAHFDQYWRCCFSAEPRTLIHGDFHPGNILGSGNAVRIIDWAAAAIGPAEWDLVMCGEPQVSEYLSVRDLRGFPETLRSAVVVRMFDFIRTAVALVFGEGDAAQDDAAEGETAADALLLSIPLYAARLVEAANAARFHGGDPVRSARNQIAARVPQV